MLVEVSSFTKQLKLVYYIGIKENYFKVYLK